MGDIHVGVTLPQIKRTWDEAKAAAQTFEELGFDSVWVCDHLYGVPTAETPILEAWSELAAVAAITERVELGSLVTPPLFRNPALFAKQIATIDTIAGGRVIVGLGAGWYQNEFEGYDCPFPSLGQRMDALEETCELLPRLWSEPTVTYQGTWARAHETVCEPKPPRKPPILIGGSGEKRLMGIAARHADIWNNLSVTEGELGPKVEALHRRCDELGRDPATIRVSQQTTVVIGETEADAEDNLAKAAKVYGGHLGAGIEAHGIWGDPDGVIRRMQGHIDKGCTMFVIEFFGRDTKIPARLFADQVLPAFS
jgi:alkanesulfonate monooxygenase SsuD/methylene tetrahydromethanopterin reductase-like flavin-dependent oxidoreductase (luciferase family)